jgi:putative ABC transport system permease protein
MSTVLLDRPRRTSASSPGSGSGGMPARRAVTRWAWRLFWREWRQQLLILALIVVAVAATIVGSTVASASKAPADLGFGTAQEMATFANLTPAVASDIATLQQRTGATEVIEQQTLNIPGSIDTYQVRSENPSGPFVGPLLSLVQGHYPAGSGQVAVTQGVATAFNLHVGSRWAADGSTRTVVGIVQNPLSLLDQFALVVPGQLTAPTQVTVLFDAHAKHLGAVGRDVSSKADATNSNAINPETISIAALVVGMLLIALVCVGGFTVLAQRRMRSLGMLQALGATDSLASLAVRANGAVVGVVGAVVGGGLGFVVWLLYRPHLEQSSHHLIGIFNLPWTVVLLAMVLAVVATYVAASRPARSITRVPIVTALSGRPAPPRQISRSALPGILFFVGAFLLLGVAGAASGGQGGGGGGPTPELALGIILLIPGMILLAPFCLSALARLGRNAPFAVRLPLRDLSRYRARSGSALAAIGLGVMIAMIVSLVAFARYSNALDYAGPNLASNQVNVYTPSGPYGSNGPGSGSSGSPASSFTTMQQSTNAIAKLLGSHKVVELETTSASVSHNGPGRNWSGPVFVATPQLLRVFGISASSIDPKADLLSMRPGLSGTSDLELTFNVAGSGSSSKGGASPGNGPGSQSSGPPALTGCTPAGGCVANPVIQEVGALPSGTSAPNTVLTEHAVHEFHLQTSVAGWLIQSPQNPTAAQIASIRLTASPAGTTIETKNSSPSSSEIIDWATVFGMVLALAILAMSVGLLRSETAGDLRTLAATGASRSTRRKLTAVTAGALGFLGAVLGSLAAYVGVAGFLRSNAQNGGIAALGSVPVWNLLFILIGMPLLAAAVGGLLAGREPSLGGGGPAMG